MTTQELSPIQAYHEACIRTLDLIKFVETLPDTKKKRTTLRYLNTALGNFRFLFEALNGKSDQ